MHFLDASTGWVVGDNGMIYKSTDGGSTWTLQSIPNSDPLYAVDFANSSEGWASAIFGTVFRTTDGGGIWNFSSPNTTFALRDIEFFGPDTGLVVGDQGAIAKTTDGGSSWTDYSLETDSNLQGLSMIDSKTGWAVGEGGITYYTTDGGKNWSEDPSSTQPIWLNDVHAVDASNVWAVGTGGICITLNGSTGLHDRSPEQPKVDVHPNPADEQLKVELSKNEQASQRIGLYDITGKQLLVREGRENIRFDVSELDAGTYFLRSETDGSMLRKMVVE